MKPKDLTLRLARGLVLVILAGFAVLESRSYLTSMLGPAIYQVIVLVVLFGALWLGAGDLIRDLKKEHKKRE